jgi:hypothetical protein
MFSIGIAEMKPYLDQIYYLVNWKFLTTMNVKKKRGDGNTSKLKRTKNILFKWFNSYTDKKLGSPVEWNQKLSGFGQYSGVFR